MTSPLRHSKITSTRRSFRKSCRCVLLCHLYCLFCCASGCREIFLNAICFSAVVRCLHQRWPWIRSRLRQESAFFWTRSQKFVKNRTRSQFLFSAVAGVSMVFFTYKHCWTSVESMVARFGTGVGFANLEILEQERGLKMWLRPPLVCAPASKCWCVRTASIILSQVKNFGRSGRTKYTHLVDQDTTHFDSPWAQAGSGRFVPNRAGETKQVFERPSGKKRKAMWSDTWCRWNPDGDVIAPACWTESGCRMRLCRLSRMDAYVLESAARTTYISFFCVFVNCLLENLSLSRHGNRSVNFWKQVNALKDRTDNATLLHDECTKLGVYNHFAIAGRITFNFMNYGRQWVQDIFTFCIVSVLLPCTEPSLVPHICLTVFLLSILIQ